MRTDLEQKRADKLAKRNPKKERVRPAAPAPAPAEQLPATGADATRFVVVALGLMCAGAGITIVSRSFGTQAALAAFRSAARARLGSTG